MDETRNPAPVKAPSGAVEQPASQEPRDTGMKAPTPTLPKGGGAIRGIGEKFAANPVTGTGSMRVPIATSPGRGGAEPALELRYDSGSGSSVFGLGWQLSVPRIARKTDKGLPTYDDRQDVFVLSDAEDLVPVADDAGAVVSTTDGDETVVTYRPRVEGLFARIERRVRADGTSYWRAVTPANVTSLYGTTPGAQIVDPEAPTKVFSWLLEKTFDDRGNVLLYEYREENLTNVVGTAPCEAPRLGGAAKITNRYLARIRYGNRTAATPDATPESDPAATDFLFEVVFDFGEHDPDVPTVETPDPATWPVRQDPFSTFRSTFEVRTYRLCRRVLMFHRMSELGAEPCLVASTDFTYEETPSLTKLVAASHAGYIRSEDGLSYMKKSHPPVEFAYEPFTLHTEVETLDHASLQGLPGGLATPGAQPIDLNGEGLTGVLLETPGACYYKRNLGGTFAPPARLTTLPLALAGGSAHELLDLDGDGRKELVVFQRPLAGYQERTAADGWGAFHAFASQPLCDVHATNARFIDLTGDGHEDLLVVEPAHFVWYPSLAKGGYGPPRRIPRPSNEERGPLMVFTDEVQTIFLADMTGDGLTDLVRIRNGSVCYWPNRGYGRFGAKVTMAVPEHFDNPASFNPNRILLADVDGSGTTDLLYDHAEGVRFYGNHAGNSLAPAIALPKLPAADASARVQTMDLRGTGTACLVWSSGAPRFVSAPLRFIDLTAGKKPHLLISTKNNLGLETTLRYASSTTFYLQDLAKGTPWATKLPFPVHVLDRVEVYDWITKHRFVTEYSYHHGYFDGVEREFRGFGRVEQRDTESFSAATGQGSFPAPDDPLDPEFHLPPVVTKTWFHTGAWIDGPTLAQAFQAEYYHGDSGAVFLPDTILPSGLSTVEQREATRALKGSLLRQEVYASDGSGAAGRPYTVSERSYAVRRDQGATGERHGVFFVHPREAIEYHYERIIPHDPRVTHAFTLEVGPFGAVLRSAAVGYPRRGAGGLPDEQTRGAVTLTEMEVFDEPATTAWYRLGVPVEARTYELTGLTLSGEAVLSFDAVFAAAGSAAEIPYEATPDETVQKRLLSQERHVYTKNDLSGALAFGSVESLALPHTTYAKAFTPALLTGALGARATDPILVEGGYVHFDEDDDWWAPSGRQVFSASAFYLPTSFVDPFGNPTSIAYDDYALLVVGATDAAGNVVAATPDYRTLSPSLVTDPNGNRAAVQVDALGVVVATAVMGKVGDTDGDTLDDPTTTFAYDLERFQTSGKPTVIHGRARETHGDPATRWQESYSYFDGMGQEVLRKVQAEPGDAPSRDESGALVHDEDGALVFAPVDPRWVGTGRTVLDNKGNPVKQYEPFFSDTFEYEDDAELVEWGVTPILRYDPLGRLVRTDLPNGTYSKVVFDPWKQTSFDPNDTVTDPSHTVADSLWYTTRQELDHADPEWRASNLAAEHAATPSVAHLDALGRTFLTEADNGTAGVYGTRLALDIEGNALVVTDARNNEAMRHIFGMGKRKLYQTSVDAGERWMLLDVAGQALRGWDGRGFVRRAAYDALRRGTHQFVKPDMVDEILAERVVYGEAHPDAATLNLRGKVYRHYDGAGAVTTGQYDFKGNLLQGERRVAVAYATQVEWSALVGLTDLGDIEDAAESLLATETFTTQTVYDALNRPVSATTPDASEVRPTYNEAGLLEKVDIRIRGAVGWTSFVEGIEYDAKGQRKAIVYGNGTATTYTYDPLTFRLTGLRTVRDSDDAVLQDLSYTYDPVGNIVAIKDDAQQTVFYNNAVVSPSTEYEYDAIYRLIQADGREHAGGIGDDQRDQNDVPLMNLPHENDSAALRNYRELYGYDEVGNIVTMIHQAGMAGSWTRRYEVAAGSNRLLSTSLPGDGDSAPYSAHYAYDAHGNMTSMPHLLSIEWDHRDQMQSSDLGGGGHVYYTYDAGGQRVRKVWEHAGYRDETIYLGGYEIFRRYQVSVGSETLVVERQTLHAMDGDRRAALVETKTVDTAAGESFEPSTVIRYQLGNHLGSAVLEVDGEGAVISYEEYHPYGTTAYRSGAGAAEVSRKRYRYTGKEKDEETGLYYHEARYYACWLGRWSAADPAGMSDGPNLYRYTRNNPIMGRDPNGTDTEPSPEDGLAPVAAPLTKSDLQSVRTYVARGYAGANPLTDNADANAVLIAAQIAGSRGGVENPVWEFIPPSESHMAALIAAVKAAGPLTLEALAAEWGNVVPDDRRLYIMNRLHEEYKYSPEAAAGIVGNLQTESGFLPTRIQSGLDDAHPLRAPNDGGKKTDFTPYDLMSNVTPGFSPQNDKKLPPNTGLGLAQWTEPKRRAGLFEHNYKGRQGLTVLFDMDAQIDYLVTELKTLKGFDWLENKVLRKPGVSEAEASEAFLRSFENPTDVEGQVSTRAGQAQNALKAYRSWVKNRPSSP